MTNSTLTAQAVADLVGGRLLGNGALALTDVGPLDRADGATLSLLSGPRYLEAFARSAAGAVLLRVEHAEVAGGPTTRIVVDDPAAALLKVVPVLIPVPAIEWGVAPTAVIGPGATWRGDVQIGPHAVLGRDVRLGSGCRIGAGAVLEDAGSSHGTFLDGVRLTEPLPLRDGAKIRLGDAELRVDLRRLLAVNGEAGSFLDRQVEAWLAGATT